MDLFPTHIRTPEPSRRAFLAATSAAVLAAPAWTRAPRHRRAKVRIGVVGGGFGCAFHWHQHPDCEVVAVSDLRADRRQRLRQTYGCERVHPSLTELLGDDEVDAVALFTEATNHARHAVACMEAGKHVISAVPAAVSLEECAALVEVQRRTGLRYMMAETTWYRYETIFARERFEEGAFGEVLFCEAEYYHPEICHAGHALSRHEGERTWRYGYPPMLYATHTTGFLVGVTGERMTRAACTGWGCEDPALKDNAYGNPFCNGTGTFQTDRSHTFRGNVFWHVQAHGERAQWLGTEAALYMRDSAGRPFRFVRGGRDALTECPTYWDRVPEDMRHDSGHGGSHPHLTHEFVRSLCEDRDPVISLPESLAMTAPGIVAHASASRGGALLDVPAFEAG